MKIPTPLRAIRLKCLDCSCGSAQEVRECPITWCPLYYYRSGHNPKLKGKGNVANLGTKAHASGENANESALVDKSIDKAKKTAK